MKTPTITTKHPDVCMIEIIKHGFDFASIRAWKLLKANSLVILGVLISLSLIQIWQERAIPILKTNKFVPYSTMIDINDAKVENFCFNWEFEITRQAKLVSFNWKLQTEKGIYFVTPWVKEHGRFLGAANPAMFEKIGLNTINLCASAAISSENEKLIAKLTYEINILGMPWTNTVNLETTFK